MAAELPEDFVDLLIALLEAGAEFLVVGGYAVAHYGHPRATKDIDIWVRTGQANASRVIRALRAFGAPLRQLGVGPQDFEERGQTVQLGVAPLRIDLLTEVDGVDFERAWEGRSYLELGQHRVPVIGRQELLANKRTVARPQDLADVRALETSDGDTGDAP